MTPPNAIAKYARTHGCPLRGICGRTWLGGALAFAAAMSAAVLWAEPPSAPSHLATPAEASGGEVEEVDRDAPDFVTASLLVIGPGDELYSCAGHAALRMECPAYGLDFCFSYESESAKDKVFTFLRGKLKMGMFAVPTEEFLKMYRETGRGVSQYSLDLPIGVKRSLWELLDNKVAEGTELPYDFMERGCAQSLLVLLQEACAANDVALEVGPWPKRYSWTLREFVNFKVKNSPWNLFFLNSLVGIETDRDLPAIRKVILPNDLLDFLRGARVEGRPVASDGGKGLAAAKAPKPPPFATPMKTAIALLVLAVAGLFTTGRWNAWFFLLLQTLAGLFFTYLVFVSDLPATSWNWLIVPFNPLPAIFWRWHRRWAPYFALVLFVWLAAMECTPHRMTDPAYLVIVSAYVLLYAQIGCERNRAATERRTAEP